MERRPPPAGPLYCRIDFFSAIINGDRLKQEARQDAARISQRLHDHSTFSDTNRKQAAYEHD